MSLAGAGRAHPAGVTVCECWARDGIQGWPQFIATDAKIRVLEAVVAAGVDEADVTSFLPASTVPQMADAEAVLEGMPAGLRARVVVVNVKGVERALAVQRTLDAQETRGRIDAIGFPVSASEPHNIANLRRDHASHLQALDEIVTRCHTEGVEALMAVATAFGCPIAGEVPAESVLALVEWGVERDVRRIMLGDTTGMGNPDAAFDLFDTVRGRWPDVQFIAHFHDNRGRGLANTLAAIEAGVTTVDASLGGTGGEPRVVEQGEQGDLGNVCTEDLVATLDEMGIQTGIAVEALLVAGGLAEEVMGVRLSSRVQRAGLR
jgi:hydroxymethylglutaryl-CoA lyase